MDNNKTTADKSVKKPVKNKKPNIFKRMWGKIKEVFSELKKVTWPDFKTVMKQLGCVLVTVVLVLVIILLMDLGLEQLLKLIQGSGSTAVKALTEVL
ncbi:MAG: preprotein translocase subunit SecE [Clostridia bacterium]|nr:preprotein translocase subunit SecE [Clostridia bacterium]MDY2714417.1 preprotein translocase subunit SecE [Christensenellaceae bacterium]MDY3724449.1 preprotein translocase subunit SecE [Christensenellaceae bacterium]